MSDMKITGIGAGQTPGIETSRGSKSINRGFDDILKDAVGTVSEIQSDAEKAITQLATGGDITQAVISMEKANMSFQAMVEVRNKLLSAYEEIMRMQV